MTLKRHWQRLARGITRSTIRTRGIGMLGHPSLPVFRGPSGPFARATREHVAKTPARHGGWQRRHEIRHRRLGPYHEVKSRYDRPPAGDQVGGKLLDQIGKEDGPALSVKEYHLGRDKVAVHQSLIDLVHPIRAWRASEVRIKDYVVALLSQSRRGEDLGRGVGSLPLWNKQVMK